MSKVFKKNGIDCHNVYITGIPIGIYAEVKRLAELDIQNGQTKTYSEKFIDLIKLGLQLEQ